MKKIVLILIIFISFTCLSRAYAASVFISVPSSITMGKTFEVVIYADLDKESINSVDMVLDYDENLLNFSGYKSENTFVKMWIDSPRAEDGNIYFSGIIPGGVSGVYDARKKETSSVPVTRLTFKAQAGGVASFSFFKSNILKNDGFGTALVHGQKGGEVSILKTLETNNTIQTQNETNEIKSTDDTEPPSPFTVSFIRSPFFSKTPSMIAFIANDLGSGIKEYQIKGSDGKWTVVKSPQPVPISLFSQILTVRAVDFYDNTRESNITIAGFVNSNLRLSLLFLTIALLLLLILVYKLSRRKS